MAFFRKKRTDQADATASDPADPLIMATASTAIQTTIEPQEGIAGIKPSVFGISSRFAFTLCFFMGLINAALFQATTTFPSLKVTMQHVAMLNCAIAFVGSFLIARVLARRLTQIADALERTQNGDYTQRLKPGRNDETGLLTRRANLLSSSAEVREKRIRESALTDALTGLPNRALLTNRLDHAIRAAERVGGEFSVALIDLDRFKWVNDTLGHDAGDVLLVEVARRMKMTVRTSDTVARLGGDEFVLLLSGGQESADSVTKHVMDAMKTPLKLKGETVDISLSIGIATYPEHGRETLALMRHADAAMYSAKRKQAGRSVYTGDARGSKPKPSSLSMLGELRDALARNQFVLEYQPKLDLNSGLIKSVEGLVRWDNPKRGRVQPGDFLPMAEQTGFMRELTSWVVAEGVRFAARLVREGLDMHVSVNVAAQDIERPDFADSVQAILAKEQVEPNRLCLEITESGVLSETATAMKNLNAIATLGVQLSVDDYGTGYSTLSQLQKLPVNELKIERMFVTGLNDNRGNATIVSSTIDLGRQLGLRVVGEGVETVGELRTLAKMGCDEIQGFYLSRPISGNDVITWVQMRHALHDSSREEYFRLLTAS